MPETSACETEAQPSSHRAKLEISKILAKKLPLTNPLSFRMQN